MKTTSPFDHLPAVPSRSSLPSMPAMSDLPTFSDLPAFADLHFSDLPSLSDLPALPTMTSMPAFPAAALPPVPDWVPITAVQAKVALMGVRTTIGVLGWLFPNLSARLFGIDPAKNPAAPYLGRLFAARELALVAPLLTENAEVQQRSLRVGMAVDSADAAASVVAAARGSLPKRAAAMTFLTAVAAVLLGWIASEGN